MTVRERVLASRLIQKIENNDAYANRIGLSYAVSAAKSPQDSNKSVHKSTVLTKRKEFDYGMV